MSQQQQSHSGLAPQSLARAACPGQSVCPGPGCACTLQLPHGQLRTCQRMGRGSPGSTWGRMSTPPSPFQMQESLEPNAAPGVWSKPPCVLLNGRKRHVISLMCGL